MKLTPKQKRFIEEYIKSGNATQAYIDAGYSATTREVARANATRLLANDCVKKYFDTINKQVESEQIADMKEVKEFWSTIMRDKLADFKDRLKASEYIAKSNGAFIDRVEHSGEMTQNVNTNHDLSSLSLEELRQLENIIGKTTPIN